MTANSNKKKYWYILFFIPLFFTPSGLYESYVTENYLHLGDTGLVFPLYFIIGSLLFVFFIMIFIKNNSITLITREIKLNILLLGLIGFLISSVGFFLNSDLMVYIRYIQMLTGFVGIFISWYLFELKKIDIDDFFGKLGIMYFYIIIVN